MELAKLNGKGICYIVNNNEIIDSYPDKTIYNPTLIKLDIIYNDYLLYNKYIKSVIFDLLYKYWRGKKLYLFNLNSDTKSIIDILMNNAEYVHNFDIIKKTFDKSFKPIKMIRKES